jgi:excisionase family DNA binding protein
MESAALTIADAARILGLSKSTISQLARERTIPSLRIGSRLLVPVKAVQEWVDGRLREDADRHTLSLARLLDYAQSSSPGSQGRRKRGAWRS